jgi:hypothetical protein
LFPWGSATTNEPILLPVVAHSEGCEFLERVDQYRGIVEEAVFDCLSCPSFLDELVDVVMGRIAARIAEKNLEARAEACAPRAPQESREQGTPTEQKVRLTIRLEAQALAHTIECRFVPTGKIELPEGQIEASAKSTSCRSRSGRAGNARLCATSA